MWGGLRCERVPSPADGPEFAELVPHTQHRLRTTRLREKTQSMRFGLRTKLNLLIIALAILAIGSFALIATPFLESVARDEVLQRSRIMMESAAGTRKYTSEEIADSLTVA